MLNLTYVEIFPRSNLVVATEPSSLAASTAALRRILTQTSSSQIRTYLSDIITEIIGYALTV